MRSEVLGVVHPGIVGRDFEQLRVVHVIMDKEKADKFSIGDEVVLAPLIGGDDEM